MKELSLEEAVKYFNDQQLEIVQTKSQLDKLTYEYKEETKQYFGVADGEPMNIVQLAAFVSKLIHEAQKKPEHILIDDTNIGGAPV